MKGLIFLFFMFLGIQCFSRTDTTIVDSTVLDITELIVNAKILMDKSGITTDFSNQPYQKNKAWKVYKRFIHKPSYATMINSNSPGFFIAGNDVKLLLIAKDSMVMTDSTNLKAVLPYNFIQVQMPYYSFEQNAFCTIIWIKDQSWVGGFVVLIYFNIVNGVCKFIKGDAGYVSDVGPENTGWFDY